MSAPQINSVLAEQYLSDLGGVPIDRMAWRVIQPGEHYERPKKLTVLCFDVMPPKREREDRNMPTNEMTQDLTGFRRGRLLVVGYWGRQSKPSIKKHGAGSGGKRSQYWICRCLCGLFCVRRADRLLKTTKSENLMCEACEYERHLQWVREHKHHLHAPSTASSSAE